MIYLYISNLILFCVVSYFVYKNYTQNRDKLIKKIKENSTILEKPKYDTLYYQDFDKENSLLKDVLESIKLEEWECRIEIDNTYLTGHHSYSMVLINPQDTLSIRARLRVSESIPTLASFSILKKGGGVISFNSTKETDFLILTTLWDSIIKFHQNIHDESIKKFTILKNAVELELKTLHRERALKNILN